MKHMYFRMGKSAPDPGRVRIPRSRARQGGRCERISNAPFSPWHDQKMLESMVRRISAFEMDVHLPAMDELLSKADEGPAGHARIAAVIDRLLQSEAYLQTHVLIRRYVLKLIANHDQERMRTLMCAEEFVSPSLEAIRITRHSGGDAKDAMDVMERWLARPQDAGWEAVQALATMSIEDQDLERFSRLINSTHFLVRNETCYWLEAAARGGKDVSAFVPPLMDAFRSGLIDGRHIGPGLRPWIEKDA